MQITIPIEIEVEFTYDLEKGQKQTLTDSPVPDQIIDLEREGDIAILKKVGQAIEESMKDIEGDIWEDNGSW